MTSRKPFLLFSFSFFFFFFFFLGGGGGAFRRSRLPVAAGANGGHFTSPRVGTLSRIRRILPASGRRIIRTALLLLLLLLHHLLLLLLLLLLLPVDDLPQRSFR